MKDKNYVKKFRLFPKFVEKKIMSFCSKKLGRYLTQDEIYVVGCALENLTYSEIESKFNNDRGYVISIVGELMNNNIVGDNNGTLYCKYYEERPLNENVNELSALFLQINELLKPSGYKIEIVKI